MMGKGGRGEWEVGREGLGGDVCLEHDDWNSLLMTFTD